MIIQEDSIQGTNKNGRFCRPSAAEMLRAFPSCFEKSQKQEEALEKNALFIDRVLHTILGKSIEMDH
jgi:hypothetical protein